ncbi:MAG TPA: hypothetical protein EYQ24_17420 [Bacteroidetes bacterium]|nr:hypothetical protein [Bacteroidota bacterium]HIL58943.1 hypothetical protein [Rhodothermales bacterium]
MTETAPTRVADLIREGRKIEAIKAVREQTGACLKDALHAVEEMERIGRSPGADPMPDVEALVREGRTAEAIALLRDRTGLGLKEATDVVDALPSPDDPAPPRIAVAALLAAMLVAIGVLTLMLLV